MGNNPFACVSVGQGISVIVIKKGLNYKISPFLGKIIVIINSKICLINVLDS